MRLTRTKVSLSITVRLLFLLHLVESSWTASKCLFILEVCIKQLVCSSLSKLKFISAYFILCPQKLLDMYIDESGITA